MTSHDAELERLHSPKQKLLSSFPKQAVYARYFKGLFRGEVELRLLPWLCNPRLVSIDAGAHHGIYALGTSLYSKGVVAIEPQHDRAEALRKSLPANAKLVEGALSSNSGTATLKIPVDDWDSISRLDVEDPQDKRWRYERVTLHRLDDVVQEQVGFIKIDVEGHEREVLDGATRVISSDKPAFLIEVEERHRVGSVDDVTRFLLERGYSGYFVQGTTVRPISEFDARTHQAQSLIGSGDRSSYSDYINNFIFIRPDATLPKTVPSSCQALGSSLRHLVAGGR